MKMIKVPRPPSPRRTPRRMLRPLPARTATREEDFEEYDAQAEPSMKLSHAFIVVLILHVLAVGGVFAFNTLKTTQAASGKKASAVAEKKVEKPVEPAAVAPAATVAAAAPAATSAKPVAATTQPSDSHTVAAGDTLTRIATQHKTTVEAIETANALEPTATIRVGQVLKIPTKASAAKTVAAPVVAKPAPTKETPVTAKPAATPTVTTAKAAASPVAKPAAAQPATEPPAKAAGSTYTVAKGDNPYSIAKKLKVGYNELIKANKIDDPTKLQIGQQLIVP